MAIEMESGYKEVEAENANDGDEVEAEVRVLKVCRFDFGNQTFEQMECLGVNPRPDDGEPVLGVWNNHLALWREVSIELLANGEHVRIGSRANLVRDAIMVYNASPTDSFDSLSMRGEFLVVFIANCCL
ncbi:hypothetical protein Tco_0715780 [Tanacetum coccineum]